MFCSIRIHHHSLGALISTLCAALVFHLQVILWFNKAHPYPIIRMPFAARHKKQPDDSIEMQLAFREHCFNLSQQLSAAFRHVDPAHILRSTSSRCHVLVFGVRLSASPQWASAVRAARSLFRKPILSHSQLKRDSWNTNNKHSWTLFRFYCQIGCSI